MGSPARVGLPCYNTDMKVVIPDERPPSWNKFYSGMHWAERNEVRDDMRWLVRSCIHPDDIVIPEGRVDITITVYFRHHPQDPDNICSKLMIDSIKGYLIEDDTREHIRTVATRSEIDKNNPRVEILVEEV